MAEEDIQERIDALNKLVDAENWDALEQAANQFIEYYPKNPAGYFFRGVSKDELVQYEEAIQDYSTALSKLDANAENDELRAVILRNRAHIYFTLELWQAAKRDIDKSLEIDPNNVTSLRVAKLIDENLRKGTERSPLFTRGKLLARIHKTKPRGIHGRKDYALF